MNENTLLIIIIAVCSCIFFGGFVVKKSELLFKMLARGIAGSMMIWGICTVMSVFQLQSPVGLNFWTAGVSAVLGMPGVLMLYAVGIYAVL